MHKNTDLSGDFLFFFLLSPFQKGAQTQHKRKSRDPKKMIMLSPIISISLCSLHHQAFHPPQALKLNMWLTLFVYVTVSGCCFAFITTKINLSFQRRKIHVPNASYLRLQRRELMMVVEDDVAAVENQWDPKAGPKLDFNEDYYSILEVESTVSPKELKKVKYYRFLQS